MFYGGANNAPADLNLRRNLGYLYANNYNAAGNSYYCPSMNLQTAADYAYDHYVVDGKWPTLRVLDEAGSGTYVRSSYVYYPQSNKLKLPGDPTWYEHATKTTQLSVQRAMLTDIIRRYNELPHGGAKGGSLNALWGDGHVSISTSREAFNLQLWGGENNAVDARRLRVIMSFLRP